MLDILAIRSRLRKRIGESTVRIRRTFALDLHDDPTLIARYRAWHAPGAVPQVVIDSIRAAGIEVMEIYLTGNRLFMITEAEQGASDPDGRWGSGSSADTEAWEALMWTFQKPLPWCRPGEKWVQTECIFRLTRDAP
jgi:L-rhamnose mutarotase